MNCAQGPTDAHDRRSPRVSPTEEAFNPTDQRVLTAFLAWPDSPVWVLLYWLGTRSTSHVHRGRRPAGAGSVEAPESNTCLPAPDISLVAAVRDWVRRANGPITTNGLRLGRQLETAKEQFATQLTCRGIDENKCIQLLRNHQTLRRRSARVLRDIRLQRDEARARRHLRLRARIQSLPQIPILAPVNVSGEQVSQNITNSTAGRIDGLRALQRRAARERRRKVAVLCPEGTRYRCSLGSITRFAPREATVTRRPLRIAVCSSLVRGLPLKKKTNKKTPAQLGTDGPWTSGRAARRTVSLSASDLRAPVRYALRSAGERITASPGTPGRNKAEPDVIRKGHLLAIGTTVVLPQVCNLTALTRPVKGAWRGYDVASTHRT